jgi:4-amino-4-deoxy-L-arabinose transferase-like glycosyltransferase
MSNLDSRNIEWSVVVLWILIAFFSITNLIWLNSDSMPPKWDQSAHLNTCLNYLRIFQDPSRLSLTKILDVTHYYPPFFYLSTLPLTLVFGFSPDIVILTHLFYLAVLVFSIYGIGKYFISPQVGAGAAVMTLLFPIVYGLSREALVDVPLLAMVTLAQYVLLICNGGLEKKRSWLLGLVMGLSFLTKWTAPIFFIGTFIFIAARSLRTEKLPKKEILLSLAILSVAFLAIALPWFVRSFKEFFQIAKYANVVDAVREGDPKSFSLAAFIWYLKDIKQALVSNALFPLAMIGIAGFLIWVRKWAFLIFALSWFLPAYIIFVGLPNKDGRFIIPLLPAVALISSAGIFGFPWKNLRKAIWFALFIVGIIQFYLTSFDGTYPARFHYVRTPLRQDWKIEAILGSLKGKYSNRPLTIGFLPDQPYFNAVNFAYYANFSNLNFKIKGLGSTEIATEELEPCDVLITKTKNLAITSTAFYREQFYRLLKEKGPAEFNLKEWKQFALPDGTNAVLYLKKKP